MTLSRGGRTSTGSPLDRPAVVEHVDFPPSTSDGRATTTGPRLARQIARFASIGVVSTLAWAGLFFLLREDGLGSVAANAVALVVTAIGNTAANRRFTFGRTGRSGLAADHGAGLIAFLLALAITTGAANALTVVAPRHGRLSEIVVLTLANLAATSLRFTVLRAWLGRAPTAGSPRSA